VQQVAEILDNPGAKPPTLAVLITGFDHVQMQIVEPHVTGASWGFFLSKENCKGQQQAFWIPKFELKSP